MFGTSAFAETPFAALPGGTGNFVFVVEENIGIADAFTDRYDFLQSIAENSDMLEFNALAGSFYEFIYENVGVEDVDVITAQFASDITEPLTLEESESIAADFAQSM